VIEGRTQAELKELLDAIQGATLAAFKAPERDRYQIVHEHPAAEIRIEDTGLGIPRTERIVMVQVTTRPKSV
jgi:Tautomerase enzyme